MIVNLVRPDKSDIDFKIVKYPDGQQDVILNHTLFSEITEPVIIKSRFNSFLDLELITCTVKALRNMWVKDIELYIPYILGARSDRQFVEGSTSYLCQVLAPFINNLNFNKVTVIDPHSDVTAACINNLVIVDNSSYVDQTLKLLNRPLIVSPDAGSMKKIYKLVDKIGYNSPIIQCSKHRDTNGKLSEVSIGNVVDLKGSDILIVDDICDGGRTFIEIAKKLKLRSPGKMCLFITHGIFSNGFEELKQWFDHIYCTNSVKEVNNDFVTQFNVY